MTSFGRAAHNKNCQWQNLRDSIDGEVQLSFPDLRSAKLNGQKTILGCARSTSLKVDEDFPCKSCACVVERRG